MKKILALGVALAALLAPRAAPAASSSPLQVTTVGGSLAGTVTTGGSFQVLLSSTPSRLGCQIVNPSTATETLYVYVGSGSPTTAKSIPVVPSGTFTCNFGGVVLTDQVSVEATTTSHAFVYMTE